MNEITKLLTEGVHVIDNVADGAVALIENIKSHLDKGIEALNAGDGSVLQQLTDALGYDKTVMVDAITINTPAATGSEVASEESATEGGSEEGTEGTEGNEGARNAASA